MGRWARCLATTASGRPSNGTGSATSCCCTSRFGILCSARFSSCTRQHTDAGSWLRPRAVRACTSPGKAHLQHEFLQHGYELEVLRCKLDHAEVHLALDAHPVPLAWLQQVAHDGSHGLQRNLAIRETLIFLEGVKNKGIPPCGRRTSIIDHWRVENLEAPFHHSSHARLHACVVLRQHGSCDGHARRILVLNETEVIL